MGNKQDNTDGLVCFFPKSLHMQVPQVYIIRNKLPQDNCEVISQYSIYK